MKAAVYFEVQDLPSDTEHVPKFVCTKNHKRHIYYIPTHSDNQQ